MPEGFYNNPDQGVAPVEEPQEIQSVESSALDKTQTNIINFNKTTMNNEMFEGQTASEVAQAQREEASASSMTSINETKVVGGKPNLVYQILTLATVLGKTKRVAFVKGNRTLNAKNLAGKKKSLGSVKLNVTPLMIVDGQKIIDEGGHLVTPEGVDIPDCDAHMWIVIIEGQHRYLAALSLGFSNENIKVFFDYSNLHYQILLLEVNANNFNWSNTDYGNCAVMFNPSNEVAVFANELTLKGFSASTIGYILYYKGGKFGKSAYVNIIEGKEIKAGYSIERAKEFLQAATDAGFDISYQKKRYLIAAVASLTESVGDYKVVLNAVKKLSKITVSMLESASSDDAEAVAKRAIFSMMETLSSEKN